jgi:hypothetical protein
MARASEHVLDLLARYAGLATRRPYLMLGLWLVVAAGCFVASSRWIQFDARFDALLPERTPSVVARREAGRRIGSTDFYLIAVDSPDPVQNFRFTQALARAMRGWPEAEWVLDRRDAEVLRRHALLFAETRDLEEVSVTLKRIVDRALHDARAKAGGFEELDDDLVAARKRADQQDRDRLKALARKYEVASKVGGKGGIGEKHPELRDALMNDSGTVAVVMARLKKGTNDVAFAREVYRRGEALIARLKPATYHPKMQAKVAGAYRSFREYDQALRDVAVGSAASMILVIGMVICFFRRVRPVIVILGPLLVGILLTAGFAALFVPRLNIITGFIVAILTGLGIDYSVHLYAAYRQQRIDGADLETAVASALREAGPGMFTAALTTMAALLTLCLAHFRAFQEFGVLATVGVLLCMASAFLVFPPLIAVIERIWKERFPAPRPVADGARAARNLRLARVGFAAILVAVAAVLWAAPRIGFEYDFSKLRGRDVEQTGIRYGSAMRGSRGSSPVALLAGSEHDLRAAVTELERRRKLEQQCCDVYLAGEEPRGEWCDKLGLSNPRTRRQTFVREGKRFCQPRILDIVSVRTFIPDDQERKLPHLRAIRETLRYDKKKGDPIAEAPQDLRKDLEELQRHAQVDRPLRVEDLPQWARHTLTERAPPGGGPAPTGRIGFVYSGIGFSDARDMITFAEDYAEIRIEGRPVHLASSSFVVADVVKTVKDDGLRMLLLSLGAVFLLLLLDLRQLRGALLCFGTLALGFFGSLGILALLGWNLGVYNMLVVPVSLGVGIDASVHVYHRYLRLGPLYPASPLGFTGLAVIVSSLTTASGFAGLFFIGHGGLQSIAQFASVSIAFTLGVVILLMPWVLMKLAARQPAAGSPGAE